MSQFKNDLDQASTEMLHKNDWSARDELVWRDGAEWAKRWIQKRDEYTTCPHCREKFSNLHQHSSKDSGV